MPPPPPLVIHVREEQRPTTFAERVTRQVANRAQQRVIMNGTFSSYNWRYDGRRRGAPISFIAEYDADESKVVARCLSNR